MTKNLLPRKCRSCGSEFIGGPRAWYCPVCREKRKKEADRQAKVRQKSKAYIPLGTIIQCEMCGIDIIKKSGRQKYCAECGKIHLKKVDNQQSLEWNKNHPDKMKKINKELRKRRYSEEGKQSGIKCITWDRERKKWRVAPYINSKRVYLGRFSDLEEAKEVLQKFYKGEIQKSL